MKVLNLKFVNVLARTGVVFFLLSCAEQPTHINDPSAVPPISDQEYMNVLKKHHQYDRKYDGLFELYEMHALLVDSEVENMLLLRQGNFMQWDKARLHDEKDRNAQIMSTQTRIMMSFFSPDFQYDDLAKPNSIWRAYLESQGKRYEGKIKKVNAKLAELRDLFPFHNRFSTAYEITFPVSALLVEQASSKFTLTSTLGTTIVTFAGN
jgi:hypothetical protein